MLRFFAFLLFACLAFGTAIVVVRAAGEQTIPPPALAAFEGEVCLPNPCWHEVRPGQSRPRDLESIFHVRSDAIVPQGRYRRCWQGACWDYEIQYKTGDDTAIAQIMVEPAPGSLHLGDVVRLFGPPLTAQLCWIATPTNGDVAYSVPRPVLVGYLTFKGSVKVVTYNATTPLLQQFVPDMIVHKIYYQQGYDITRPAWRGFAYQGRLGCGR